MDYPILKKNKFILLVLLLVLLPIIYYSIYEISSLNENEQIIQEVYEQQMNLILYSINKSAWEICNDWMTNISQKIGENTPNESQNVLSKFLEDNNAIRLLITCDTLFMNQKVVSNLKNPPESAAVSRIIEEIQTNNKIIFPVFQSRFCH